MVIASWRSRIKAVIRETLGDPGYILLMAAVVTAAWLGGIRAGLSAVAIDLRARQPGLCDPGQSVHER